MKSCGPSGPSGGGLWETPRESVAAEGLRQSSAARATAVAEAVAAVAASEELECGANSQLEALNLMLPRSVSLALGSGKLEGSGSAEKISTQGESAVGGPSDSSRVLHGYQALRAIRTRAHKFRTGYHNWRRHQAHGARGDIHDVFIEDPSPSANASLGNISTECEHQPHLVKRQLFVASSLLTKGSDAFSADQHEYLFPVVFWAAAAGPPILGRGTETAGILMSALKSSGSVDHDRGTTRPGGPLPPTPMVADAEKYGIEVAHDNRVERPQWLRFFFNPHTPLQSEGVWPLRRDFLSKIAARASVPQYSLDSSEVQCWIAHVGVGGFHRSHQCVFYDDLLAKTSAGFLGDLPEGVHKGPWAVCGIGILPGDKKMSDILHEQEFLYTVLTRSQRLCEARVIGSLMDFVFAPEEPKRLKGLLVDERTKMLSLTITEKGYCMATDGNLDKSLEPVKQDLKNCTIPKTALGLIYLGLKLRRAAGIRPFTVLSCDNIPNNGKLLKKMVIQFATEVDVEMATWISKHVSFPCTMVDRITPLTGNEHITLLQEDYGVDDKWPVVAEDFKQWVIGDSFCNDRPFFEAVGCLVVREVQSYEEMKLKLLNAGHSCVAYVATMLGYRFVDEAVRDVRVSGFLRSYMDEVTPCLQDLKVDVERYKERIVERFGNAFVKDELQRIAQDGSSKFYSTTRSAVLELIEGRKNVVKLSVALAAWMLYFATDQVDGCRIEPCDPKAPVLRDFARTAVQRPFDLKPVGSFLNAVYGLPGEAARILTRWVTMSLAALQTRGIAETLDAGGPLEALLDVCFKQDEDWQSFVSFTNGLASC